MSLSVGHQIFQLCGAMMILAAYVCHQFKWIDPDGALYNILNGVGSAILGYYALWPRFQAGFVVLEVAWTGVSMYGLWRAAHRERKAV
jgi:hypothetical protein